MGRLRVVAPIVAFVLVAVAAAYVVGEPSPARQAPARTPALLGYDAHFEADYTQRAAAGSSHVVYAKSPDGVLATAARVAEFRPLVEHATAGSGISADLVEGIVFLESAGRPDVVAGDDAASAAGLGQVLAETATNLLGMHVDLAASRSLTTQIAAAGQAGDTATVASLQAERRAVDDRFEPALALAGTVRYLELAQHRFGRTDLAVESYHMGMGNLEGALRAFAGKGSGDIATLIRTRDLGYTRLFFDSSPLSHPEAYAKLAGLGDESASYLWKVFAAVEIMRLYREDRAALQQAAALQTAAASAEVALHPDADPATSGLVSLIDDPARTGYAISPALAATERRLQPAALDTLTELAGVVQRIAPATQPLEVMTALGDGGLDAAGYTFAIARHYSSGAEAAAFQFTLDRLQALNRIAWQRLDGVIRITVAG